MNNYLLIVVLISLIIYLYINYYTLPLQEDSIKYKFNKYIILFNYNTEGGFFWNVHNVCLLCYLCEKVKKIPIVYFHKGYYLEPIYGPNWWEYYYKPIYPINDLDRMVNRAMKYGFVTVKNYDLKKTNKMYRFDRTTFTFVNKKMNKNLQNYNTMLNKYIKLNGHMSTKINNFFNTYLDRYNVTKIGVHYRGTDKFANANSHEDHPVHIKYENVSDQINNYVNKNNIKKYVIYVASDEEPFIDYMFSKYDNCVSYNAIRSSLSTSGIDLKNSIKCFTGDLVFDKSNVCQTYKQFYNMSVHKGYKNKSAYTKGEDVVVDVYLLSKCDILFKTKGNVSSMPKKINSNLIQIDMTKN